MKCTNCGTTQNLIRIQPPELAEYFYYLCEPCKRLAEHCYFCAGEYSEKDGDKCGVCGRLMPEPPAMGV
jgi:hypothetical protein